MDHQEYLDLVESRLEAYFDIDRDHEYQQTHFDLYAKSNIRSERYFASKKLKIYAMENNEHVFLKEYPEITDRNFRDTWQVLMKAIEEKVDPHEEHMSTAINGVLVTSQDPSQGLIKEVEKIKYNKSFAFGFKGWVFIRFLVINRITGGVFTNRRGKEVSEVYAPVKQT